MALSALLAGVGLARQSAKASAATGLQQFFLAHLTGAQETPPNSSPATGFGSVTLNADQTSIIVNLSWSGLTTAATVAHIHGPAAPGVAAAVLFPLAGVPTTPSGTIPGQSFAVTPLQVAQLQSGLFYFNVHTSTVPAGEIRGQIMPAEHFGANLDGGQETPPHASAATGSGSVSLSSDQTFITVDLSWTGLTTAATLAHIHGPAGFGVAAPILIPFTGVPAATSGSIPEQSFAVTPAQVAQLRAGLLYFNVHTTTFPGGEIRGQILAPEHFAAKLDGAQETPPHVTAATGSGSVTLSSDQTSITVDLSWTGLTTPATLAHIHGPAGLGVAAPVLIPFAGVPGVTSGSIPEQTFAVTAAQVAQLRAGLWYFNVHTATFPGGEIRGQILLAPDSQGIRMVAADGQVVGFGRAPVFGTIGGPLNAPAVGISGSPDNQGYWLVGADGGVFTFGDAAFFGSLGAIRLNSGIVGIASTPDGKGYWLVGADGGIFTFGDAAFFGSVGAIKLNGPVVGLARTPDGSGYWLAGADGGVFTFGNATFLGSVPGDGPTLKAFVLGIAATGTG